MTVDKAGKQCGRHASTSKRERQRVPGFPLHKSRKRAFLLAGDVTWQTNFLGPFLLTELLARLRSKEQSEPVRPGEAIAHVLRICCIARAALCMLCVKLHKACCSCGLTIGLNSTAGDRVVQVSSRLEKRSELNAEMLESIGRGEAGGEAGVLLRFLLLLGAMEVGDHAYADSKRALMLWTGMS